MDRFLNLKLPNFGRKVSLTILAVVWLLGLLLGTVISICAGDSLVSLMRMAVSGRVSISGLLSAMVLPFLLSALAVYIQKPVLLVLIAFGKAFLVSYLGLGAMAAYGSAGWLVRWLLMFSDCCSLPLLWLYWLRLLSGKRRFASIETAALMIAVVLIGSLDYCVVSPFLAVLIS